MQLLCILIILIFLNLYKSDGIERIGSSNFYTSIAKYDKIVIIFMDRVKDRSHVLQILDKAQQITNNQQNDIKWFLMDLDEQMELGKELKITGSNKFRIYQDHDEDNFHEFVVHNEHMISNYILRYFKYDICELSSENQTLSYLTLNYVSVIYYGPVDDEKFNVFKQYVQEHKNLNNNRKISYGIIIDPAIKQAFELQSDSVLFIYQSWSKKGVYFNLQEFSQLSMDDFLLLNAQQITSGIDRSLIADFFQQDTVLLTLYLNNENKQLENDFNKAALIQKIKYRQNNTLFVINRMNSDEEVQLIELMDIDFSQCPCLTLLQSDNESQSMKKYKHEIQPTYSLDEILQYVEQLRNNQLKEFVKSEPIPDQQFDQIEKIVGSNFDEKVLNSTDDVLCLFYSEYDESFMRIYDELMNLAQLISQAAIPNFKMYKIDHNRNDISIETPPYQPALLFFKNNRKNEPVEYLSPDNSFSSQHVLQFIYLHSQQADIPEFDQTGEQEVIFNDGSGQQKIKITREYLNKDEL